MAWTVHLRDASYAQLASRWLGGTRRSGPRTTRTSRWARPGTTFRPYRDRPPQQSVQEDATPAVANQGSARDRRPGPPDRRQPRRPARQRLHSHLAQEPGYDAGHWPISSTSRIATAVDLILQDPSFGGEFMDQGHPQGHTLQTVQGHARRAFFNDERHECQFDCAGSE